MVEGDTGMRGWQDIGQGMGEPRMGELRMRGSLFIASIGLLGALLAGSTALAWQSYHEQLSLVREYTRARVLVDAATQVEAGALQAVRGERGYLLTNDVRYLAPFRSGRVQMLTALDTLQRRDPALAGLAATYEGLRVSSHGLLRHLDSVSRLNRNGDADAALARVRRDEAGRFVERIGHAVLAIRHHERERLDRVSGHARAVSRALYICLALMTLAGLLLIVLAVLTAVALRRSIARERAYRDELRVLALTDELTGLANRRELMAGLERTLAAARRKASPCTFAIFDIDHFKLVNDTHGHATGDEVLRHVARLALETLRTSDTVARIGGEEFAVILPDTTEAEALVVCERLRERLRRFGFQPGDGTTLLVTMSIGVARYNFMDDAATLMERADAALYRAKEEGRNRVRLAA